MLWWLLLYSGTESHLFIHSSIQSPSKHQSRVSDGQACCDVYLYFYLSLSLSTYSIFIISQVVLAAKNLPANAGDARDMSSIPGQEDPLEEETAPHSSILAWRNPWSEETGGLQSVGSESLT